MDNEEINNLIKNNSKLQAELTNIRDLMTTDYDKLKEVQFNNTPINDIPKNPKSPSR